MLILMWRAQDDRRRNKLSTRWVKSTWAITHAFPLLFKYVCFVAERLNVYLLFHTESAKQSCFPGLVLHANHYNTKPTILSYLYVKKKNIQKNTAN